MYADGPDNFTLLGDVTGVSNTSSEHYDYASYMHVFYYRKNHGTSELPYIPHELVQESWYWGFVSNGMTWMNGIGESAYNNVPPILRIVLDYIRFPEDSDVPRKPQSKYRHLLPKLRNRRLQARLSKRLQASEGPPALFRDNFVSVLLELLETLKRVSLADHNITITSATISRPSWVSTELNYLFDEACLLADIEVLEQPHSRVDMSTKEVTSGKSVLVIDHGYYHLDSKSGTRRIKLFKMRVLLARMVGVSFRCCYHYRRELSAPGVQQTTPVVPGQEEWIGLEI